MLASPIPQTWYACLITLPHLGIPGSRYYAHYLRSVANNPDFVGTHWFQYVDEPLTGRTLDGENGHVGFVTVADLPYKGLVAAAREANQAVLRALERSFAASR
jgi:hypothetical protein